MQPKIWSILVFGVGVIGNFSCGVLLSNPSKQSLLSYANSTGTTVAVNQTMKVTPSYLSTQPGKIVGCKLLPGGANTSIFPASLQIDNETCVISGVPTQELSSTQFVVQATYANGILALAPVTLTVLLGYHQGWTSVQALGGRSPVTQATGLASVSPSVTLSWNAMTSPYTAVSSYNVYRSTSSVGQDFTKPLATGISSTALTYTDTTVSASNTYYYVVRPVVAGYVLPTKEADSEIKISVPSTNMVLVHRWMANLEMCSNLMGRTPDRTNHYRCAYSGPLSSNGYFDYGRDQYWDVVPMGCNYTPPNSNASLSCGSSVNGCLGNGTPQGSVTGGANQVYYDRTNVNCFIWTSGTNWTHVNSASSAQLAIMTSNQPGLPPIVNIDQAHSQSSCQQFSYNGVAKRLPKHSEQVVAFAWPTTYTDAQILSLENGSNLPTTGACNSNNGSGLTFDANATPADLETLPGSTLGSGKAVRTGSNATKNCLSMYGIQDAVGNIWQLGSDTLNNCSSGTTCLVTSASLTDSTNTDWYWLNGSLGINFNGIVAPGGSGAMSWQISNQSFSATRFLAPLGIPLVGSVSSSYDSLNIGTGSGQINPSKFHGNYFYLDPSGTATRGLCAGGAWYLGSISGRFTTSLLNPPTYQYGAIGYRCMTNGD